MNSLAIDQKIAQLDSSLLDILIESSKLGKKDKIISEDKIVDYYVIDTQTSFSEEPTWHHSRVNNMCKFAKLQGYNYLVILININHNAK